MTRRMRLWFLIISIFLILSGLILPVFFDSSRYKPEWPIILMGAWALLTDHTRTIGQGSRKREPQTHPR